MLDCKFCIEYNEPIAQREHVECAPALEEGPNLAQCFMMTVDMADMRVCPRSALREFTIWLLYRRACDRRGGRFLTGHG